MSTKEKIVSALSYLWILFFLPLVLTPNSKFGRFHANQALLNLILGILCAGIGKILGFIPVLGGLIGWILGLICAAFTLWGIVFSLLGEKKPFPLIGGITIIR